jgi:hypothetical protein
MSLQVETAGSKSIVIGTLCSMTMTVALGFFVYDFFQDNLAIIQGLNTRGVNIEAAIGQFELIQMVILVSLFAGLMALAYSGYRQLKKLERVRNMRDKRPASKVRTVGYCRFCGEERGPDGKFCLACGEED